MRSVRERVAPEVRRKTGWLLPVAASIVVGNHLPGDGELVERSQQLWLGGLGLAGVAIGLLWQWYSPRELSARLFLAAGAFVLITILALFPIGGEMRQDDRQLYLGLGVISGLVLANWWKWLHTPGDDD
jgi:4-amino-4-deoxy-L-arabinose transferase-like glycosyltransferase